jgi:uncharacterized SAM-binding protein YcdF (DUF218 family)
MYRLLTWLLLALLGLALAFQVSQLYQLLLLLLGMALVWQARRRPEQRRLRWLAVLLLLVAVLSMPVTAYFALGSLEWQYPPPGEPPEDVQALVVLGSGVLEPSPFRPEPELDPPGHYRTCHAARVYKQLARAGRPCLVLASGGKVDPSRPGPPCGELMLDLLVQLGVPSEHTMAEVKSRSTYENALYSAQLLHERGLSRVLVVTDGWHLPRALACFRKQGLQPTASGCQYYAVAWETRWQKVIPEQTSLGGTSLAVREWLGTVWYTLCGRI